MSTRLNVCRDYHGLAECTTRGAGSNMSVRTRHLRSRLYARWLHAFLRYAVHVLVALITAYSQAPLFSGIGRRGQFIIYFTQLPSTATHPMEQSPSWEATQFSACQEITRFFNGTRSFITAFTSARAATRECHTKHKSTDVVCSWLWCISFLHRLTRGIFFHISQNLFK